MPTHCTPRWQLHVWPRPLSRLLQGVHRLHNLVSIASPFTRGGRVWSTSHCSSVNRWPLFPWHAKPHWCASTEVLPRAVHTCYPRCMYPALCSMAHADKAGQNNAEKRHSLPQSADSTLYWLPTADSATKIGDVKLTKPFLLVKMLACKTMHYHLYHLWSMGSLVSSSYYHIPYSNTT